ILGCIVAAAKFDCSKQRRSPGTAHQLRDRGSGDSLGTRKLRLGLRSNCGSVDQPRAPGVGSDRGQHSAPPRDRSSAREEQNDRLEGFIRRHMDVLAGTDFFTVEVLTWRGLVTYCVLFFIHRESRLVSMAGITDHPDECWMRQMGRNATFEQMGYLNNCRYV